MSDVECTRIHNSSLAKAVRQAGFDISIIDQYSENVKEEAIKESIKEILHIICDTYEAETGKEMTTIKKGVYVISLSNPFVIKYPKGYSDIIYIGQGNVYWRLKAHFEKTLFRLMQSLVGTNFDLLVCEPKRSGGGRANNYYKHVEYLILEKFSTKFGGNSREDRFPLLNKNAGSDKELEPGTGWEKPLSMRGKSRQWALSTTKNWNLEKLG